VKRSCQTVQKQHNVEVQESVSADVDADNSQQDLPDVIPTTANGIGK